MGLEVEKSEYCNEDYLHFFYQLEKETLLLKNWIENGSFSDKEHSMGVELEAWITDDQAKPSATNLQLLKHIDHHQMVPELSQYNIEINGTPHFLNPQVFSEIATETQNLLDQATLGAKDFNRHILTIGVLPTLNKSLLSQRVMTPYKRYFALNDALIRLRQTRSLQIHITGKDILQSYENNIMLASAATSFQFQWKIPFSQSKRVLNAIQILTPAATALSANSPFVFKNQLWEESRVPLFEHAVVGAPSSHSQKRRATFGNSYLQDSFFEYYLENLIHFPILLPAQLDEQLEKLSHLNLHNGTIWRWNRPIIGFDRDGTPHIRVEHRAISSGPTVEDNMATMAFLMGASYEMAQSAVPFEMQLPYSLLVSNFYKAARTGLSADQSWVNGSKGQLQELIQNQLAPMAERGLEKLGIDKAQINHYIKDIILNRTQTMQNGSRWQQRFFNEHKDFKKLTQAYLENQLSQKPVHSWT